MRPTRSEPKPEARPPGWGTDFGGWLRREREARGVPLVDVAQRTRIKLGYLELIEVNRTEDLPAEVFVRGFVRAYARAIGADPAEAGKLLSAHFAERSAEGIELSDRTLRRRRARRMNPALLLGGAVLLAIAILVIAMIARR